ncbi:MAG: S41 family peptidase [Bacteroidaceae bacterium]|nr:S41 family peptidase [Bacteroidaceae bacterium]
MTYDSFFSLIRHNRLSLLVALLAFSSIDASAQRTDAREVALRKLLQSTVMINQMYVDTVNIQRQVEDAITGMLSKLDPHSAYTNAADTKKMNEPLQGNFDGIGVQFNMLEDTLVVIQPVSKGPSEKVGILAGDRIVSVNDTAIAGVKMSRENIMSRLRGPKGTKVQLGVVRRGIEGVLTFVVKRDKIPVNSLDAAYMIRPGIGLVRFSNFAATTHQEVTDAIRKLQAEGMKTLILDLQGNGGGYLNAAAELASEFLPKDQMIVYTRGRGGISMGEFRSAGGGLFTQGRIVVLVDEYSASAAEILSGAIQDHDRGTIVGRRTFGKGLVQRPIELDDGSMIRLTIARYYTPSGRCIQKPYEKGDAKAYARDVIDRYNRGELSNADSIHFPDSLRYKTLKLGRTVYGGGGIMPDIFVPLDTTRFTRMHRELNARSYIINASLRYIDMNRKQLHKSYPDFDTFLHNFTFPREELDKMFDEAAKKDSIQAKNEEELQKTVQTVSLILKGLVARDLWDMSEYFQVIYEEDPVVQQALELLRKEQE